MRAEKAAASAGVTVKALRYYEDHGLLSPVRLSNGYRDYGDGDVALAREIRELMALGLSVRETRPFLECLRLGHDEADDCPESVAAYQEKIDRLDRLIGRLAYERAELGRRMRDAARRGFRGHAEHRGDERPLPAPDPLPADLPAPVDDGAAAHLTGMTLPPLAFIGTDGTEITLDTVSTGRWILFLYPLTGEPGVDVPRGWDQIPGARGCSQQACNLRDNLAAFHRHGVQRVVGLSTDRREYQQDLVNRLQLPYPMVSDPALDLARALNVPTFEERGRTYYRRITFVVDGARISHVFHPVFPPDRHAEEILDWLAA
jgi:peroxiredoxin/DNA-binding transcriptional MerR regulator